MSQVQSSGTHHSAVSTQHSVFVGRETELTQLHSHLENAWKGARQVIFVTGEPGIGKTALVEAFLQSLASSVQNLPSVRQEEYQTPNTKKQTTKIEKPIPNIQHPTPKVWLGRGQCIEQYGAGEAYLPILEALVRLCHSAGGEQVIELLGRYAPTWLAQLPTLLDRTELEEVQRRVQSVTRERLLHELAEALEKFTEDQLLVLWLDDLHWADTATVELLSILARRREPAKLLLLGVYRPLEVLGNSRPLNSVTRELQAHGLCTELALELLSEAEVAAYLEQRFPQRKMPTQLAHVLHQRTEGNPLFLSAIVQDLIAQEIVVQTNESWEEPTTIETLDLGIPESIRQLVARQRERLGPVEQQVLEAASVAGLEFSAAAVAAALESEVVEIEERCQLLSEHQHFLQAAGIEEWPDGTVAARYRFLHALYQQLWHERVSVNRRQQWHCRIGVRKESAYGQRAPEIAAELAIHFEQGRDYPKAVQYLQYVADTALRRSATCEAIAQVSRGLDLLKVLPETSERLQRELTLHMTLGGALRMSKGFAAPEAADAYARARSLCRQLKDTPQLFSVLWGLSSFYVARADIQAAREVGERLVRLASRAHDSGLLVEAHARFGLPLYLQGELLRALEHLEQGLKLYDPRRHRMLAFRYGQDPGVISFCYAAIVLWCLGYPERAQESLEKGLRLARELAHPNTLAYALYVAAAHAVLRREERAAHEYADALTTLATEWEFPHWRARGIVYRGWAQARQGRLDEGIVGLREGINACRRTGAEMWQPYFRGLLAGLYSKKGQPEQGLALITEALAGMDITRERISESELYRLKGELMLQLSTREWGLGADSLSPQASSPKSQSPSGTE